MLYDRSYMQDDPLRPRWSMTTIIIVVSVVIFAIQEICRGYFGDVTYNKYLALSVDGIKSGFVWQLLTFQFLHGGLMHLLFNMLVLFFFGRFLEERLGSMTYLKFYLAAGATGGIVQIIYNFIVPTTASVVGASAGVCGVIAAFALIEPHAVIRVWGIIPVKAIYFLYFTGGIALFYTLVPVDSRIAHAAHLGGVLAGVIFMRWDSIRIRFSSGGRSRPRRYPPRELIRVRTARSGKWGKRREEPEEEPLSTTEFISREVDPILDKISKQGLQSLTPKEREILEAARSKMRNR